MSVRTHFDERPWIGSSQVAALVDLSPWLTRWQLYQHFAHGVPLPEPVHERIDWGRRLEDDILDAVMAESDWRVAPNDTQDSAVRHRERRGCTPDAWAWSREREGVGIIECKNCDFFRWAEYGKAPPIQYEVQLQHQLDITGCNWGAIATLVGGNDLVINPREADASVQRTLREATARFWADVAAGREPDPFGIPIELETLNARYPRAEVKHNDLGHDDALAEHCALYDHAGQQRKFWDKAEKDARVHILAAGGDAEIATVTSDEGRRFEARITKSKTDDSIVRLPEEMRDRLAFVARSLDGPLAAVVREAIDWSAVTRRGGVRTRLTVREIERASAPGQPERQQHAI